MTFRTLKAHCPFCGVSLYRFRLSLFVPVHKFDRSCSHPGCSFYQIPVQVTVRTAGQVAGQKPYYVDLLEWD